MIWQVLKHLHRLSGKTSAPPGSRPLQDLGNLCNLSLCPSVWALSSAAAVCVCNVPENIFPKLSRNLSPFRTRRRESEERCHGYVPLIVIIIESFKNLWPTFRLFSISNRKMRTRVRGKNSPSTQIIIFRRSQIKNNFNWLLRRVFWFNTHSKKTKKIRSML